MEISANLEKAINEQIGCELAASNSYLSMAAYFEGNAFDGFSKWMRLQCDEERMHAMKFYQYLIDREGVARIPDIPAPEWDFKSVLSVFEASLDQERSVTRHIYNLYQIAQDESDFAIDQAWAALDAFDKRIQEQGKEILEQVERENRIAILVIGRPYHLDPGLHHGIPDEFQVRGYPILSIRSLPKDPEWLARYFGPDEDPLDIRDVWPENYSANSAQKVWAAKFAARHPNVAVLDLSSFKCGHDAPTYGIIDKIVSTSKVPYSALHDLDANKPGGSILIRVLTYTHKLKRVEEELEDRAKAKAEHARKVADRRAELRARIVARREAGAPPG